MSAVQPFDFDGQAVRVVTDEHGDPWFVARDVCGILGYAKPRDAIARLDPEQRGSTMLDTLGGPQQMSTVNEDGLNDLILDSRKPSAKALRRWVTRDVLPSIRKTGAYGITQLSRSDLARMILASEAENEEKARRIAVLEPKAEYVDTFVADDDLRLMRNIAKPLDVSEHELRRMLIDARWIYTETSRRWSEREQRVKEITRYSPMADKRRYFRPVPVHDAPRFRGEVMHTLKVTPEGAAAIARLVGRRGMSLVSEVTA